MCPPAKRTEKVEAEGASFVGQADSRGTCYTPCTGCSTASSIRASCEGQDSNGYCADELVTDDCIPVAYQFGSGEDSDIVTPVT